jgi:hypothetical protein
VVDNVVDGVPVDDIGPSLRASALATGKLPRLFAGDAEIGKVIDVDLVMHPYAPPPEVRAELQAMCDWYATPWWRRVWNSVRGHARG